MGADELLTTKAAAKHAKVHAVTVQKWVREGGLPAILAGTSYLIKRSDLDAFKRRRAGRPAKRKPPANVTVLS